MWDGNAPDNTQYECEADRRTKNYPFWIKKKAIKPNFQKVEKKKKCKKNRKFNCRHFLLKKLRNLLQNIINAAFGLTDILPYCPPISQILITLKNQNEKKNRKWVILFPNLQKLLNSIIAPSWLIILRTAMPKSYVSFDYNSKYLSFCQSLANEISFFVSLGIDILYIIFTRSNNGYCRIYPSFVLIHTDHIPFSTSNIFLFAGKIGYKPINIVQRG